MDGLRRVTFTDPEGRRFYRMIPMDADEREAEWGVPVGPPSLANLGLPLATEVRLNNELFHRELLTESDIKNRRVDAHAAVMAAYKVDVDTLLASLAEGKEYVDEQPI